jgi:uncharacterized repeat protein (TIGR01451 family)
MIYYNRLAALAAGTALIAMQASPAMAEGTLAGTTITNTATIDYRVGGVDQTAVVASDSFVVDRKINVVVTQISGAPTIVSPGQTGAVISFTVANLSNAAADFALALAQEAGDDFDVSGVMLYLDDGNGVFDGADTVITYLDEIASDQTVTVHVVSNVPLTSTNGEEAAVVLSAIAHEPGQAGVLGDLIVATTGPNSEFEDTVFADTAGYDDAANDGRHSARGLYEVFSASLTVNKTSRIISDPVNGTTNPKAIPTALIEYCVAVGNASGSAIATNVTVTDPVPGDLTFDASFGVYINGSVDGSGDCLADGTPGGSFTAGTVTATLNDVLAGETLTLYFRATIN